MFFFNAHLFPRFAQRGGQKVFILLVLPSSGKRDLSLVVRHFICPPGEKNVIFAIFFK